MKNNKKFLSIMITFFLLVTGTANFNVYAEESSKQYDKNANEEFLSEEDVFEALAYTFSDQTLNKSINNQKVLSPSGTLIDSFDSESYSEYTNDEYGGMYLNDDGVLVLCYAEGSNALKVLRKNSESRLLSKRSKILVNSKNEAVCNYIIKPVKYSEKELLASYDLINKLAECNNIIKTVDIDIFSNRVVIGVLNSSDISVINDELDMLDGIYAFEILDEDFEFNNIATISGTSAIHNNSRSSTPAGKMYSSTLNKYGVITCGHDWSVGNAVYKGSTKIGTVKYRKYNSTNDSSFILLNSGHSYSDTHNDELSSSVPVVGSSITLRGYVSGKVSGAKVLSTNSSVTSGGTTYTGMIKCDKQMKLGDSGGGAIGKIIDNGRTASIVAINKAIGNNCTYLIKGKVILDAYR